MIKRLWRHPFAITLGVLTWLLAGSFFAGLLAAMLCVAVTDWIEGLQSRSQQQQQPKLRRIK